MVFLVLAFPCNFGVLSSSLPLGGMCCCLLQPYRGECSLSCWRA